jgi:hypothetical protein
MSEQKTGMATEAQLKKIEELTSSPDFGLPVTSFLKNITGGIARSVDELTSAQANDVINVFAKLKKKK